MSAGKLRFFLDEGVPFSVGKTLTKFGHEVIHLQDTAIGKGSPDNLVCLAAMANDAILVALDGDMKQIAKKAGASKSDYRKLSLLKLSCPEPDAKDRVAEAMSLIEHEWEKSEGFELRRIFVEISTAFMKSNR